MSQNYKNAGLQMGELNGLKQIFMNKGELWKKVWGTSLLP